jgi:hypothetical protein
MTALELLLVLILAGVVIVLVYSYLQNDRTLNLRRVRSDATDLGGRIYGEASNLGERVSGEDSTSGMGEKSNVSGVSERVSGVSERFSDVTEKINVSGVSEKMSGMGETIKGKVSGKDDLNERIDLYLNEKSDQLIKDWNLATKDDVSDLEKRFLKVSGDLDEYKVQTNNKIHKIENRLNKLENPKE